jgi:hypothetical protein
MPGSRRVKSSAVLIALASLGLTRATSAQVLRARVTDALTDDPVAHVNIAVLGDVAQQELNNDGRIVLPLKHGGSAVVIVRRVGYEPLTTTLEIPERDTLSVHFVMQRTPTQLDAVNVAASAKPYVPLQLRDFEDRRAHHSANFIVTPEDVYHQVPVRTSDLLHRALSVSVAEKGLRTVIVSNRISPPCIAKIGVDGQIQDAGFDINAIPPNDVYGIEVFNGPATTPAEYGGTRAGICALVMVWRTRSIAR